MRILVVDDEPRLAQSLARMLESQGHEATVASDGLEAWDLFEHGTDEWDLVITDIRMPRLDGVGLAQRLRESGSDIRVLFISGHGERPDMNALSPATFLAKPFRRSALLEAMEF